MRMNESFFFYNKFPCCSKSGNQPQGDLAKSGYKINRELENLGIRLHVVEPQEPIKLNMAISKEKILEIYLPKSSQNLDDFKIVYLVITNISTSVVSIAYHVC